MEKNTKIIFYKIKPPSNDSSSQKKIWKSLFDPRLESVATSISTFWNSTIEQLCGYSNQKKSSQKEEFADYLWNQLSKLFH